jgi:hypothetical protein
MRRKYHENRTAQHKFRSHESGCIVAFRGVLDHPKFGSLKSMLGLSKFATLGLLESLWHFTGRYTPAGNIGKYTDSDIAIWLEWPGDPAALISALVASRWIDTDDNFRLLIHDWPDAADNAVHGQLARRLQRFANGELPRTRSLNSGERKRYNDGIAAGEVVIRERMIPADTVQGALQTSAGSMQGSVDARSVVSSTLHTPCITSAVPVPASASVPASVPASEHLKAYRLTAHPFAKNAKGHPVSEVVNIKSKPPQRARASKKAFDPDDF